MNIKIVINNKSNNTVSGTMYEGDTMSNIGTIWMKSSEFDQFVKMLTFGISEDSNLEVEDTINEYGYIDSDG